MSAVDQNLSSRPTAQAAPCAIPPRSSFSIIPHRRSMLGDADSHHWTVRCTSFGRGCSTDADVLTTGRAQLPECRVFGRYVEAPALCCFTLSSNPTVLARTGQSRTCAPLTIRNHTNRQLLLQRTLKRGMHFAHSMLSSSRSQHGHIHRPSSQASAGFAGRPNMTPPP